MNRSFNTPKYNDLVDRDSISDSKLKAPSSYAVQASFSNMENHLGGHIDEITTAAKESSDQNDFLSKLYDTFKNANFVTK